MHFPDDFKKRAKAVLPVKWHKYVDEGSFAVIGGQLDKGSNFSINAETIVEASEAGLEKENIFDPAQNAVQRRILNEELMCLWKNQFGTSD